MERSRGRGGRRKRTGPAQAAILLLWAATRLEAAPACPTRTMRVTFYTCAESSAHCLTKRGNQPMPFRTVAVGDRALLGQWLYVEDLGGWVQASDTGARLGKDSLDVFIGEARMTDAAHRLGVQHWDVRVCAPTRSRETDSSAPVVAAAGSR